MEDSPSAQPQQPVVAAPAAEVVAEDQPEKSAAVSNDARFYAVDDEKLEALKQAKPWMSNPKHFQKVSVSPSAIMKMMMHCASGVSKGIAKGGNPIEVMGLLLGRPDPVQPTTLIVTDAFPLPIEGFETRVIADDQAVVNHMIALNESLEHSRKEKFMGWYHSHPFDLGDHSHCFLSQTDLSTQLQWQRLEDPHGNPFVAMVLDPLRASHQGIPEIKAFRAYPPEYQSPVSFECPDGTVEPSEKVRLEHWGSCWNRYYELSVDYFMSTTSRQVLEALTSKYLWISNLKSSLDPAETTSQLEATAATSWKTSDLNTSSTVAGPLAAASGAARDAMMIDTNEASSIHMRSNEFKLQQIVDSLSEVASKELVQATKTRIHKQIFSVGK